MLKAGKVLGFLLLSVAIVGGSFVFLRDTCSLHSQSISANLESRQTGADREEQKNLRTDPSATFELRVTEPNKIEGSYFSKNTVGEPSDWGHKFLCDTKIGEFAVACLTLFLVVFTGFLWHSTDKLWSVTREMTIVTANVEGPMPLVLAFNLVQYDQIPGEVAVSDPVPPGPIPANTRVLFCIENKGRTPLRMVELCLEKFAGTALPPVPSYTNIIPWGLVLEKGPIWIRPSDEQAVITPAELGRIAAAYPEGAFWVYGYFSYRNLLDEIVQHNFLGRWDLAAGFVADNRAGYT